MSVQSAINILEYTAIDSKTSGAEAYCMLVTTLREILVELGKDEVKLEDAIDTERGLISMIEGLERRLSEQETSLHKMWKELCEYDNAIERRIGLIENDITTITARQVNHKHDNLEKLLYSIEKNGKNGHTEQQSKILIDRKVAIKFLMDGKSEHLSDEIRNALGKDKV